MKSYKKINCDPGAGVNFWGKISNPENGLSDLCKVTCRSRDKERRPRQGEGTVARKWEETHPPLCNGNRVSLLKWEISKHGWNKFLKLIKKKTVNNIRPLGNRKENYIKMRFFLQIGSRDTTERLPSEPLTLGTWALNQTFWKREVRTTS